MMLLAEHSSEFERIWAKGRSVCTTTFGLRGSDTSTPVKFFGALSCASQMIRRPSLAMVIDMPSPMPPKPPRLFWASSLKFQVMGSPFWASGLAADIPVSVVSVRVERPARVRRPLGRSIACYAEACLRNSMRSALSQSGIALTFLSSIRIWVCLVM